MAKPEFGAVVLTDGAFNVVNWGPRAERLFGWRADEAIGAPVTELARGVDETAAERIRALEEVGIWEGEATLRVRAGELVVVRSIVVRAAASYLGVHWPPNGDNAERVAARAAALTSRSVAIRATLLEMPDETPKQRRRRIVAINIRRYRLASDLNQEQLAHRLEVRREHVVRWETGVWEPSPDNIERLGRILGVRPHMFYVDPDPEPVA